MEPFPCPKTVVVMRKSDGAFLTGGAVRQLLKIPKGRGGSSKKRVSVDTASMPDFSLFVQSTSHNRVLLPDTKVLYRVDPAGKTPPGEDDCGAAPAAATPPVAVRRGRGKRGGGVARARPMTSTAKKSVAKKRSEPKMAAKNDEVEAEAEAPKRTKTSASSGDQGFLLLGITRRGMSPES